MQTLSSSRAVPTSPLSTASGPDGSAPAPIRARSVPVLGAVLLAAVLAAGCGGADRAASDGPAAVDVYSHRHYPSDQRLFDRFTERTGIEVNVVTGSADQLITRLETEGAGSPADLLITVDAGRLHRAESRDLLQPVQSDVLEERIPAHLRDPDGAWYGLTKRARIVAYAKERVDTAELSTYRALAEDRWEGRVLVRSSENVYNQSLLASIIAARGPEAARAWAAGIVENMARPPRGGDTDQAKAVAAGVGDVAIVNTYYVARLKASDDPDERRVGEALGVHFPNQDGRGAHVNVSGGGVTAAADNPEGAVRLLEFLAGAEAQAAFSEANYEYPVNPGVEPADILRGWGEFRADTVNLARLGELNDRAVRIFDEVAWR